MSGAITLLPQYLVFAWSFPYQIVCCSCFPRIYNMHSASLLDLITRILLDEEYRNTKFMGSEAHPASYPLGTGGFFAGGKAAGA
jgi:hypothetical protein